MIDIAADLESNLITFIDDGDSKQQDQWKIDEK